MSIRTNSPAVFNTVKSIVSFISNEFKAAFKYSYLNGHLLLRTYYHTNNQFVATCEGLSSRAGIVKCLGSRADDVADTSPLSSGLKN